MEVDFGVEVIRDFEAAGEVTQGETPGPWPPRGARKIRSISSR